MTNTPRTHDFYQVLSLPSPSKGLRAALTKEQVKSAYHKSLLKHHPDKASLPSDNSPATTNNYSPRFQSQSPTPRVSIYTVDEITAAYRTISDPKLKEEYDRSLRLSTAEKEKAGGISFRTGLEVVDLEDLVYEESPDTGDFWYRGCRCGDDKGFMVTEEDLEREAEHGEIVVGCRGCSLWMKILFAVEDDEDVQGIDQTVKEKG